MNIAQLNAELALIADVAVVIALLPERSLPVPSLAKPQLQATHGISDSAELRFADQQVNVFGHYDISINPPTDVTAGVLQAPDKQVAGGRDIEIRLPAIAAECEKVGLPGLLETMEAARHKTILDRFAVLGQ